MEVIKFEKKNYVQEAKEICSRQFLTNNRVPKFRSKKVKKKRDMDKNIRYLHVPYEENNECKKLGGEFNWDKRQWHVPIGVDDKPFEKWFHPMNSINEDTFVNPPIPDDFEPLDLFNTDTPPMDIDFKPWIYEEKINPFSHNQSVNKHNKPNTRRKNGKNRNEKLKLAFKIRKSRRKNGKNGKNVGKWMLFYNKKYMNEKWKLAIKLFRENKLNDVMSMKCSTKFRTSRASREDNGVIILYCSESQNENKIMQIGKVIMKLFNYNKTMYYKTNTQTCMGTRATGQYKNHLYKLDPNFCYNSIQIERQYPIKKKEKSYPIRYKESIFEQLNKMINNPQLQKDYKKWKSGVNYKTNRRIKIGGKLHKKLESYFMIHSKNTSVLFEKLININSKEYLKETKQKNYRIELENNAIRNYNKKVDKIIEEIKKLESWSGFVWFEGKKYGLCEKIRDGVHIENDCLGKMKFIDENTEYIFNDRPFCNWWFLSGSYFKR